MRNLVCFLAIVVFLISRPAFGQEENRTPAKRHFSISKETTLVTGPLRPDGSLDFIAAVNQRMSQGVTKHNNAARFIIATFPDGFDSISDEKMQFVRDSLKIHEELLPMGYPQLVGIKSFSQQEKDPDFAKRFWDAFDTPQDIDRYPLVLDFMQANDPALDAIVDATRLDRFFLPLQDLAQDEDNESEMEAEDEQEGYSGTVLLAVTLEHVQTSRHLARLLFLRSMLRLEKKEYNAAWSDILAIRRLGFLVGSGPFLIDGLVGNAIRGIASDAAKNFLERVPAEVDENQSLNWSKMVRTWQGETVPNHLAMQLGFSERLMFTELLTLVAEGQLNLAGLSASAGHEDESVSFAKLALKDLNDRGLIDWDEGLRWVGSFYDRLAKNSQIANPIERAKAQNAIVMRLTQIERKMTHPSVAVRFMADRTTAQERARMVCSFGLALLAPAAGQVSDAVYRQESWDRVVEVSLLVLAWRQENRRFPTRKEIANAMGGKRLESVDDGQPIEFELQGESGDSLRIQYNNRQSEELNFAIKLSASRD